MLNPQDINVLMNQCRVELTGVSDAGLKAKMYEVMDEFFRDTSSWKEQINFAVFAPTSINPNPLTYTIAPVDGQIIRLEKVTDADGNFVPALMEDIPTVQLQHAVNTNQTFTATVTKNISLPLTSDGFPIAPDWVLQKWHIAIKHGMLGTLKAENNKSYSDKDGAKYHLAKFRQFVANVRSAVLRANTAGAQAWRFPQAFRANTQKGGLPPISGGERTF